MNSRFLTLWSRLVEGEIGGKRASAENIIDEIIHNMRVSLEKLRYSTLAPSVYRVFLHNVTHEELRGVFPMIEEQATRALHEELQLLEERSVGPEWLRWLIRRKPRTYQFPQDDCLITFHVDPDGTVGLRDVMVESALTVENPDEMGGCTTRRTRTSGNRPKIVSVDPPLTETTQTRGAILARFYYEDDDGRHCYDMTDAQIKIGRGNGGASWDLKIKADLTVAEQHACVRYDPALRRFLIKDLSTHGTTVNGRLLPSSVEYVDGQIRELGIERVLESPARIGLGDVVFLQFEAVRT